MPSLWKTPSHMYLFVCWAETPSFAVPLEEEENPESGNPNDPKQEVEVEDHPKAQELTGAPEVFTFPEGYASRGYTRDNLSKIEQRYFDDLDDSKDPGKAQVVLDKFDLCHQAGLTNYDDTTAFVEGRVTLEELLKDQADLAEVRRRECEHQQQMEEKRAAHKQQPMELPCM